MYIKRKEFYVVMVNLRSGVMEFIKTRDARFQQNEEEFEEGWRLYYREAIKPKWALNENFRDIDNKVREE